MLDFSPSFLSLTSLPLQKSTPTRRASANSRFVDARHPIFDIAPENLNLPAGCVQKELEKLQRRKDDIQGALDKNKDWSKHYDMDIGPFQAK